MVTRRTFLSGTAAAAGALVGPTGISKVAAQSIPRRRRVAELSNTDPVVATYRDAVRRLKAARGPVTWETIARVHQQFCPHGNWYFLPWHRAYLVMVENIIREVTGDRGFAMPYWDWTRDRSLPAQFNQNAVAGNPLFERSRTISPSYRLPENMVGPGVVSAVMAERNFESFGSSRANRQNSTDARWIKAVGVYGRLEEDPHNGVHGTVGGEMGDMLSPRDPVFWLHHCNIDRIWAQWNQDGHRNSDAALWLDMRFDNHFLRPDGSRYSVGVRDVLEILPLGYRYGLGPEQPRLPQQDPPLILSSLADSAQGRAGRGRAATGATVRRFSAPAEAVSPGRPLELAIAVPTADVRSAVAAQAGRRAAGRSARRAAGGDAGRRVLAVVRDIKAPPEAVSTRIHAYVASGRPATSLTPADPGYVSSFSFFGIGHAGHAGHGGQSGDGATPAAPDTRSALLDLTPALQRLVAAGEAIGDKIGLTLVAEPVKPGDTAVAVVPARVDIAVE